MWVTCLDIYGSFLGGKSKSEFPNPKTDFAFLGGKSKNGSWIHKINTLGGFVGSNPIRSLRFTIWAFFGKGFEKSIFDNRFSEQSGTQPMPYMHDILTEPSYSHSIFAIFFFLSSPWGSVCCFFFSTRSTRTCRCHGKWSLIFGFSIFLEVKNPYDLRSQTVFGFSKKNASINYLIINNLLINVFIAHKIKIYI